MLSASETTCLPVAVPFFPGFVLLADEFLQRNARKLRAPALTCAQDDKRVKLLLLKTVWFSGKKVKAASFSGAAFFLLKTYTISGCGFEILPVVSSNSTS